jgi:hypothetical protein
MFDRYTLLAQNWYETNDWLRMYIIFVTYVFILIHPLRKSELPHSLLKNTVAISTFAKLALVSKQKLVSRSTYKPPSTSRYIPWHNTPWNAAATSMQNIWVFMNPRKIVNSNVCKYIHAFYLNTSCHWVWHTVKCLHCIEIVQTVQNINLFKYASVMVLSTSSSTS